LCGAKIRIIVEKRSVLARKSDETGKNFDFEGTKADRPAGRSGCFWRSIQKIFAKANASAQALAND
jgi:hypothetical protein